MLRLCLLVFIWLAIASCQKSYRETVAERTTPVDFSVETEIGESVDEAAKIKDGKDLVDNLVYLTNIDSFQVQDTLKMVFLKTLSQIDSLIAIFELEKDSLALCTYIQSTSYDYSTVNWFYDNVGDIKYYQSHVSGEGGYEVKTFQFYRGGELIAHLLEDFETPDKNIIIYYQNKSFYAHSDDTEENTPLMDLTWNNIGNNKRAIQIKPISKIINVLEPTDTFQLIDGYQVLKSGEKPARENDYQSVYTEIRIDSAVYKRLVD